jgi:serine/threonine protein phosphatase 1
LAQFQKAVISYFNFLTKFLMGRTFVIGDIHGAHRALVQCLQRANFNYSRDHLISLGDVADGWPETRQCIDELLKIKNLTYLLGNHDFWTLEWMQSGHVDEVWFGQGGKATIESYEGNVPPAHLDFLKNALRYFQLGEKVFVHAGIEPHKPLETQTLQTLLWDRSLARAAIENYQRGKTEKLTPFDAVYIGHTPISGMKPLRACDVWLMDCGAGWSGALSIMNIDTEEYFTSDEVPTLYPGIEGRRKKS